MEVFCQPKQKIRTSIGRLVVTSPAELHVKLKRKSRSKGRGGGGGWRSLK